MENNNTDVKCFSCIYAHSCKYYNNNFWDYYIMMHPEDGCPAIKYAYESIYEQVSKEYKEKELTRTRVKKYKWN